MTNGAPDPVLIRRIRVSGLLSFGPEGIDLELKPLNVFIGPNGSGKSNLIEAVALLRASATSLGAPVNHSGGVRDWLWKGADSKAEARIEAVVANQGHPDLRHGIVVSELGSRLSIDDEWIENDRPTREKSSVSLLQVPIRAPRSQRLQGGEETPQTGTDQPRGVDPFASSRSRKVPSPSYSGACLQRD